jgi:membrane protein implicated in regulation of membrane protease activity
MAWSAEEEIPAARRRFVPRRHAGESGRARYPAHRSGHPGEVELFSAFHGIKKWQAEADETIEADENISVIESSGIKLLVRKKDQKQ